MPRTLGILLLAVLLGAPAAAQPQPYRGECRRLTKQIARYVGDVERAQERGNELWEHATLQHIDRLASRRASLCPQYAQNRNDPLRRLGRMLGAAASLAAKYFTFGAL